MLQKIIGAVAALALTMGVVQAQTYVVGAHMPLTGNLARSGQSFTEGLKVAEYLHNQNSDYKVRLQIIDDESNPAKAITATEKLISDGAVAVIGGYGSNIIAPASEAAQRYGIAYMTAGAVSDELTQRGMKNFFRINNNIGYAKSVNTLLDEIKPETVSILINTRSDAPSLLADAVASHLDATGVNYVKHTFDATTSNFQPLMNRIRLRDKPDVILMLVYENDYIGILRAAKLMKIDVQAMVGVWSLATSQMQTEFPDLVDKTIGSVLISWPVSFDDEEGEQVQKVYNDMYGRDIDYSAVYGYIEAKVVFDAVARLAEKGDFDKTQLPEEIRATNTQSLIGQIRFDETGENIDFSLRMGQHQGNTIPIVSPADVASQPLQLPARSW